MRPIPFAERCQDPGKILRQFDDCFAQSYEAARSLFRRQHAGEHASYPMPDTDLSTDVIVLGERTAKKAIMITSGVHGVEGFAGSGCQVALLRWNLSDLLPDDIKIVLVHAVNPHGFSHVRRVNEANIDLNRHFVDRYEERQSDAAYERVADILVPEMGMFVDPENDDALISLREQLGSRRYQEILCAGQVVRRKGAFYRGEARSWSRDTITRIFGEHLGEAETVALIDIHTGLGPFGYGELNTAAMPNTPDKTLAEKVFGSWLTWIGDGVTPTSPMEGTFNEGFRELAGGRDCIDVTLEFGTYKFDRTADAILTAARVDALPSPPADLVFLLKRRLLESFVPDDSSWRFSLATRARAIASQVIAGLEKL